MQPFSHLLLNKHLPCSSPMFMTSMLLKAGASEMELALFLPLDFSVATSVSFIMGASRRNNVNI